MTPEDPLRVVSRPEGMNAFQARCREAIRQALSAEGLAADFVAHPSASPPEDGAAMFVRADLAHGGRHYKICIYPDGAGANVGSNWYVLEAQDYSSPEALIRTFCDFLRRCLRGRHPVTAFHEARSANAGGPRG